MEKILGNGGTLVTEMNKITAEFATGNANTFAGKIAEAIKTPPNGAFTFKDEYNKFETAVNNSVAIIDEALDKNDLTELDTTNLKALKSYLTETLTTVDTAIKDSGLDKVNDNQQGTVTKEKLEKIKVG